MTLDRRIWAAAVCGLTAMAVLGCLATSSYALITPDQAAAQDGTGVFGFNNVGQLAGASAVYIGDGWVLTATHVGTGPVTFSTGTFAPDSGGTVLSNPDSTPSDLLLFHVAGTVNLPTLAISVTSPVSGQPLTIIGEGTGRTETQLYWSVTGPADNPTWTQISSPADVGSGQLASGYAYNNVKVARAGANTVGLSPDGTVVVTPNTNEDNNSFSFYSYYSDTTSTLADGDSGGAAFSNGVLLGIADAKLIFTNQPDATAVFGDGSLFINLATYEPQIAAITGIGVPEPASLGLLGAGVLLAVCRRRRTGG